MSFSAEYLRYRYTHFRLSQQNSLLALSARFTNYFECQTLYGPVEYHALVPLTLLLIYLPLVYSYWPRFYVLFYVFQGLIGLNEVQLYANRLSKSSLYSIISDIAQSNYLQFLQLLVVQL